MKKKISIIHDFDGRKYFSFLEREYDIKYFTSRPIRHFIADIIKRKKINFSHSKSLIFMLSSFFLKNESVILAMGPGSYRLILYLGLIKNNNLIYHTSWVKYKEKVFLFDYLVFGKLMKKIWWKFLKNKDKKIVTVTAEGKKQLNNLNIKNVFNISHSCNMNVSELLQKKTKEINLLFVGRLTDEKGVLKALEIVKKLNKNLKSIKYYLNILGNGKLKNKVISESSEYIIYHGFLSGQKKINVFNKSHFILVPSLKKNNWEELFGVVIIEGLSCGVIPISTNHVGPREIINHKIGFLFDENEYVSKTCETISRINKKQISNMSKSAYNEFKKYKQNTILNKWKKILEL